jgi:betaine-aldehyde dehydrogenase
VSRQATDSLQTVAHHIGGTATEPASGNRTVVVNPATEEPIASVAEGDERDVAAAVEAANGARRQWADLGWSERATVLRAVADRIEEHAEELALLDVVDAGIPLRGMRRDVANSVSYVRYYAGLASELKGHSLERPSDHLDVTVREPFGVVGRIVPFNHPLQFAAAAIAAPLAAGNTVVLKPAEQTPLSALRLSELLGDLLPAGVLNVVAGGRAAGEAIAAHPGIPRIGFTGSVATGKAVMRTAADEVKVVTLELGGKNPLLLLPDVAPERAADLALIGMNLQRTAGQSCGSTSRVYAHRSLRAAFVEALAERLDALVVGDPSDEQTDVGPLAFEAHRDRVVEYIELGQSEGATLRAGGAEPPAGLERGFYVRPTLLDGVEDAMRVAREEIFGPVVSVLEWDDEDDLVERANALDLGLTANVATNDLAAGLRLSRALEAGFVWVNGRGQRPLGAPFGGHKWSGLGEENSLDELRSYTRVKHISLGGG